MPKSERKRTLDDLKLFLALDAEVLKRQRRKIDAIYNRACDLRDAYPNGLISADEYEFLDTEYGRQYCRAWRTGLVRIFTTQTREFRKRFTVRGDKRREREHGSK